MSALGYGDSWGDGDSPRPGERPEDACHWQSSKPAWRGLIHAIFRECEARKAEAKVKGSTFATGRKCDVNCPECREAIHREA